MDIDCNSPEATTGTKRDSINADNTQPPPQHSSTKFLVHRSTTPGPRAPERARSPGHRVQHISRLHRRSNLQTTRRKQSEKAIRQPLITDTELFSSSYRHFEVSVKAGMLQSFTLDGALYGLTRCRRVINLKSLASASNKRITRRPTSWCQQHLSTTKRNTLLCHLGRYNLSLGKAGRRRV